LRRSGSGIRENAVGALRIAWAVLSPFLRRRRIRWGVRKDELARRFPGDVLVPNPRWQYLHAITIDAPARDVWPWIAPLGQERGGFYSYELLENLAGCRVRNAERVFPEWQGVAIGDRVRLHPDMPPLRVAVVEPGHALVLHARDDLRKSAKAGDAGGFINLSWALIVEDDGEGRSRLFSRDRVDYGRGFSMELTYGPWIVEPLSFAMDTAMLRGIKARAERAVSNRA